jgi:sec-independent protein translocase protein TatA
MFAWSISGPELVVLLVLAVLLFGKKLPEVAAYLGKALKTFQNSWHGIETEVESVIQPHAVVRAPQRISTAIPKFGGPANSALESSPMVGRDS